MTRFPFTLFFVALLALCSWLRLDAGSNAMSPAQVLGITNTSNGAVSFPFVNLQSRTSVPSGASAGDMWYRSDTGQVCAQSGSSVLALTMPLSTVANSTTLANPTSTTVLDSLVTIPAGALAAGRLVEVVAFGKYTTAITVTPTIQLGIAIDGTDVATTGLISTLTTLTDKAWAIRGTFLIRTSGSGGTMVASMRGELGGLLAAALPVSQVARTGSVSINTTTSHTVQPSAYFGVTGAANAITCEGLFVTVR